MRGVTEFIKEHNRFLENNEPDEALLAYHRIQIGFLQHERLVHLIVMLFIALCALVCLGLFFYLELLLFLIIAILLLVLTLFYILHYYRLENTVHIHAASADEADRLDDLLWTFRDGSFVPHHRIRSAGEDQDSPVTVGCDGHDAPGRDLLINLCGDVPAFADGFGRIAELVTADPESKQLGRTRFASYRDNGYTLETHDV